jgi:hypothetical protein
MMGSDILEVAIGLIFVFLLASLVCTAVQEGLESLLRRRSAFLKKAMAELLVGPGGVPAQAADAGGQAPQAPTTAAPDGKTAQGEEWLHQFYQHPLISSLYLGKYDRDKASKGPSYIPSAAFAAALIDLVCREGAAAVRSRAEAEARKGAATPAQVEAAGAAAAAPFKFDAADPRGSLGKCLDQLPEGYLKSSLTALLLQAGGSLAEVTASLERWFNHSMDRVAGNYKRYAQLMILLIAAVVTFSLNLNVVVLARQMMNDSVLRHAIVAQAEAYGKEGPAGVPPAGGAASASSTNSLTQRIQETTAAVQGLGLPIGWERFTRPASTWEWITVTGGWLATLFAISLGAPFWFDTLNKVVEVRAALSPEAAQKRAAAAKPKQGR